MPVPRTPRPPDRSSRPRPPSPPNVRGTLRLSPIRSRESVDLDQVRTKTGQSLPPFVRFDRFMAGWKWEQGEHVTTIGPTGVGKTRLNRVLLRRRSFVVVLGVKNRDPELYGPFEEMGYEISSSFSPEFNQDEHHVLFVPRTDLHGAEARAKKSRAFRDVLNEIEDVGHYAIYCDDVQYLSNQLRLRADLEEIWILGRSEKVSLVVSSQEPVDIPVMAYGFATHLFLFKNPDLYRARRMAELTGINREVTEKTLLELPRHEFLYVNKDTGQMLRSKVIL